MSIHAYTSRFFVLGHVRDSVLLAVRWGLIAFAVMAALRRAGHIRAVRLPGRRNVAGFVEAEVIALVNQEVKS